MAIALKEIALGGLVEVDGQFVFGGVDEHGRPVERPKCDKYRYNYSDFVIWRASGNPPVPNHTLWSDHLYHQEPVKYEALVKEHLEGRHYLTGQAPERIQALLRAYFEDPELTLVVLLEGCNAATGAEVWKLLVHMPKYPMNIR